MPVRDIFSALAQHFPVNLDLRPHRGHEGAWQGSQKKIQGLTHAVEENPSAARRERAK